MTIPESPTPNRTTRPRWMDVRVIGGVLLLVASVVIGAKVIGASAHTAPVWAAAHDIAAGTVLQAPDVVAADVNLGDSAASYLNATSPLNGQLVSRDIRAGELVPVAALGAADEGRVVAVSVSPARMAPGVVHGSVIDLYLTVTQRAGTETEIRTEQLLSGVTVQHVKAPASGGLSGAMSSEYQVAVRLSPSDADALVRKLPTGKPLVVLESGGDANDPPAAVVVHGDGGK